MKSKALRIYTRGKENKRITYIFIHTFDLHASTFNIYYILGITLNGGEAKHKTLKFCNTNPKLQYWHREKAIIVKKVCIFFICKIILYISLMLITIIHILQVNKIKCGKLDNFLKIYT